MSSIYICRSLVNILCFARAKLHLNIDVYLLVLKMKSAQRRCKHCALAVVILSQKLSPRRRPFPGGAGWPKFNQLETVTIFTYKLGTCKASRFDSNSNRTSRFEFDSKVTFRFENFESAAHAVCRHTINYRRSLTVQQKHQPFRRL